MLWLVLDVAVQIDVARPSLTSEAGKELDGDTLTHHQLKAIDKVASNDPSPQHP